MSPTRGPSARARFACLRSEPEKCAARCRWILSGTPIQNSVSDLYSYFRFLKWAPFDKQAVFRSQIADVIKRNAEKGYRKLQQILKVPSPPPFLCDRPSVFLLTGL